MPVLGMHYLAKGFTLLQLMNIATRDSNEMGELYNFLGLSVGLNINSKSSDEKRGSV